MMITKLNKYLVFSVITFALLFNPSLLKIAYAKPIIPGPAKVHVAPFRVIEIEHQGLKALCQLRFTTVDLPVLHETGAGDPFDGVGILILERSDLTVGCNGTLLSTGIHVLTAGHCVTDEFGDFNLTAGTITFEDEGGDVTMDIDPSSSIVHPDWDGDPLRGNDLAILRLYDPAPVEITRRDIYRGIGSIGSVGDKIGYGMSGQGGIDSTFPFGIKRGGQNKYDAYADTMLMALGLLPGRDFVRQSGLHYDFDNGTSANDAFGFFFEINDTGLGLAEVISAPGDSGGPTNRVGQIMGVTSYGITLEFSDGSTADVTPGKLDSSYGEFSGDTNVAKYSAWIDDVTGVGGGDGGSCSPGDAFLTDCEYLQIKGISAN